MNKIFFILMSLIFFTNFAHADYRQTKLEILRLAQSFQGQGDPDGSKQAALEVLVEKLLRENPQGSIPDRLPLLYGAWKQVWGPYSYGGDDRGVDPKLDPKNIVQVIFEGGYYYNVNPNLDKNGRVTNTILLRGEFALDPSEEKLNVQFTDLRKIPGLPTNGLRLQDLPALSEIRNLPNERTVLPSFIVRLFFGGGFLEEVYTDEDLRITFGTSKNEKIKSYIYVLKRLPL